MKTMVDNVCTLAIEASLVLGLHDIFCPSTVMNMDAAIVSSIAAESDESIAHREQLTRQCGALQAGLVICIAQLDHGLSSKPYIFQLKASLNFSLGFKQLKIKDDAPNDETPSTPQSAMSSDFEISTET
jgi:hypothetical protein